MSTSSNRILTIYKSRKTILDILDYQDYNVADYDKFTINEIDAMNTNDQLDMLIQHTEDTRKIYIKYYLNAKQLRPQNLDDIIEDLFVIENVLTRTDTLIIITQEEPNDTIVTKLKYLYDHDGIFVVIHNIKRLQFNILNHTLVPDCEVLTEPQVNELKKTFNISNEKIQLPEISRFDPQSLAMCLRPGQVCCFKRDSATAMKYNYYRICV